MSAVTSTRGFVGVVLRQLVRDKTALFFMLVLPVLVIVIIGITFGGTPSIDVGVVDHASGSPAAAAIVDRIDAADGAGIVRYDSVEAMRQAIRRQTVSGGIVLPADLDARVAAGDLRVTFVADPAGPSSELARDVVVSALASVLSPVDAATFAAARTGEDSATALEAAGDVASQLPGMTVETVDVGREQRAGLSRFSLVAPQQLVLFVFINAAASGAALVRMRRTGVLRRALAGPSGAGSIVGGVLAAWFVVALAESLVIVGVGAVAFDVDWGHPLPAAVLVVLFALVGAGAGLLVGAVGGNEDRVGAITPPVGLVLGALGGCMVPLEVFSPTMRTIAHATPHYWAVTAWEQLVFGGDGLADVGGPLLALACFATVFVGVAAVVLRRALVRG